MFDHLDDPEAPDGRSRRDAVLARGRRRLIVRRTLTGSGSAAAVVAVVLLATSLAPADKGRTELYFGPRPDDGGASPLVSASASVRASHLPSTKPTHKTSPKVHKTPRPGPSGSASGCAETTAANCPDGKPGWADGTTDCFLRSTPQSTAPDPALTFSVTVDSTSAAGGTNLTGTGTITNTGTTPVSFLSYRTTDEQALVLDANGSVVSGLHHNGLTPSELVTLDGGQSRTVPVSVGLDSCGDTSHSGDKPLPPGVYQVVAFVRWQAQADSTNGTDPIWLSQAAPITVTS